MPKLIKETGRSFAFVRYIASHQQLLFRSEKGEGGATRAEILFAPVQFLAISTLLYEVFNIYTLTAEELASHVQGRQVPPLGGCTVFGLGGPEVSGVVVAQSFTEHEDDGEFWEPSSILRFDR